MKKTKRGRGLVGALQGNVPRVLMALLLCGFQTSANAGLKDGLVAHWSFDDCTAKDVSGNGHDGIQHGTKCLQGNIGNAFFFDGNSDYLEIPDSPTLSGFAELTLSAWIYKTAYLGDIYSGGIITKWYQHSPGSSSKINQDTYAIYGADRIAGYTNNYVNYGQGPLDSGKAPLNQWIHIVFTHSNTHGGKLYIDGKLKSSVSTGGKIVSSSNSVILGADNNRGSIWRFFQGSIDEARIYNRALSDTEIKALYQQGQPSNVVLFLHGMNTDAATWNDAATQYYSAICPGIYDGKANFTAKANAQGSYCYRVNFGANDQPGGLEDAWGYAKTLGKTSGDFSSFNALGAEVNAAINAIRRQLPNPQILLVAHSRGGLAARAFLQHPAFVNNKPYVAGLITTGTPHGGSKLGRIYGYIANDLLSFDGAHYSRKKGETADNDWKVVDFLNGKAGGDFYLDARRPVIGDLSENSPMLKKLNAKIALLPDIAYGQLVYDDLMLGIMGEKFGVQYGLFNDNTSLGYETQLSTAAEGHIKGWVKGQENVTPRPSKSFKGDGIVLAQHQQIIPSAITEKYDEKVLHTEEPKRVADIAAMTCVLGFPWLTDCSAATQAPLAQPAAVSVQPADAVSHDYDNLVALPAKQLWQQWLAVLDSDYQANTRQALAVALGIKLRAYDEPTLLVGIKQHLADTNATALERARVAQLLAEIATPAALNVLVEAFLNNDGQSLEDCASCAVALSNAIKTVADSLPETPRRADLSAVLETAWLQPDLNPAQLNTLALAIAKLGTPRGVDLLLAAVEKNGVALPSTQKPAVGRNAQQALAAFLAMGEIINPDSETVLSSAFSGHRAHEAVFVAAGQGLVNLGSDSAAQQVLQRLDELPASDVAVGQRWLGQLSGKIAKASLRRINQTVGSPKQPVLKLQMEEMLR